VLQYQDRTGGDRCKPGVTENGEPKKPCTVAHILARAGDIEVTSDKTFEEAKEHQEKKSRRNRGVTKSSGSFKNTPKDYWRRQVHLKRRKPLPIKEQ